MPKSTVTFELGGSVDINELRDGIDAFRRLITALTPRGISVKWIVADLQVGSATATLQAESDQADEVDKIVTNYEEIGSTLARHQPLDHYGSRVVSAANAIASLVRSLEYVRFETPATDFTIYRNGDTPHSRRSTQAVGAITGQVQTLSNRAGLRFNLYDTIHDRAVACYLEPGQEDLMLAAWGRKARVSGMVSREGMTGKPTAIRRIINVEIIEERQIGSYQNAKGAVPWEPGFEAPEDIIRRMRDA